MPVRPDPRDRLISALLSAGLVALLGWLLVTGLGVRMPGAVERALETFEVAPPAPPPPVPIVPAPARNRRPEGEAAPPNLRSTATPVVAPVPIVIVRLPSPVPAAPVADFGGDPTQGAAAVPGPGTGAGGIGDGRGSGGRGDGDGGGWEGEEETPPRRIRGRLRYADHPQAGAAGGVSDTVSVRYYVEVDGRVSGCRVTASSGNAALDATTCRLITERFRYRPSLDARGRPVRSVVVVDHDWGVEE